MNVCTLIHRRFRERHREWTRPAQPISFPTHSVSSRVVNFDRDPATISLFSWLSWTNADWKNTSLPWRVSTLFPGQSLLLLQQCRTPCTDLSCKTGGSAGGGRALLSRSLINLSVSCPLTKVQLCSSAKSLTCKAFVNRTNGQTYVTGAGHQTLTSILSGTLILGQKPYLNWVRSLADFYLVFLHLCSELAYFRV